jgi:hypothetical protein
VVPTRQSASKTPSMAVAVQHPSQTKPTPRGSVYTHNPHPREYLELVTDVMSYPYPPSQNGEDMDLPHPGYLSSYPTPSTSSLEVRNQPAPTAHPAAQPVLPAQAHLMSLAQRRESLSKAFKMRRFQSTPNLRPQGMNETDHNRLGSMADKKPGRNKLGYHRTSVACSKYTPLSPSLPVPTTHNSIGGRLKLDGEAHCRRRKIRCQPQAADMQGRCSNCIRLKKDCSFYSVGQEPPAGTGQKAGARPSGGPKIASASSSPAIATGHPPEISTHAPYSQLATMPTMQNMGPPSLKPEAYPADPKGRFLPPPPPSLPPSPPLSLPSDPQTSVLVESTLPPRCRPC